jgi:endoglucanase
MCDSKLIQKTILINFLENKDDWPFLWGENEVTIGGCADYIFLGNAVNDLVSK